MKCFLSVLTGLLVCLFVCGQAKAEDNLAAHWSFEEIVGDPVQEPRGKSNTDPARKSLGQVLDSSGNANHGTVYGATLVPGVIGSAISFVRENTAYVDCGEDPSMAVASGDCTIMYWVKVSKKSPGSHMGMVGIGPHYGNPDHRQGAWNFGRFGYSTVGEGYMRMDSKGFTPVNFGIRTQEVIYDGKWHHIAYVKKGVEWGCYTDGVMKRPFYSPGADPLTPSGRFTLGTSGVVPKVFANQPVNSGCMTGLLDEVYIYSRTLSTKEIRQHYKNGVTSSVTTAEEKNLVIKKVLQSWQALFPKQKYLCWAKSPWDKLSKLSPPPASVKECRKLKIDMGRNEYESASFVLTNLSDGPIEFEITCDPKGISTTLRKGVWITAKDGGKVNDALSLIDDGLLVIPSGESLEIWITLHGNNAVAGKYKQTINVLPKDHKPWAVNINVTVHNVSLPEVMPLSTCYWDYVTPGGSIELNAAKLADLKSHYVNTATVHPSIVPRFEFDENGQLITDYTKFDAGMDMYEAGLAPETYLLEMLSTVYFEPSKTVKPNYPGAKNRPEFLTAEWKTLFAEWLTGWVAHMKSRGMGYDKYYISPFDERLDDSVYQVAKLIKETDPQIRVHTNALGTVAEINKIAPYVDVWQPLLNHWLPIGGVTGAMSQTVPLSANTAYTFSFYGKNGSSTIYWDLVFDGATPRIAQMEGSTEWKQYTHSFTTASDTTRVQVRFFPAVGNGNILIDDVVLVGSGPNLVVNGDMEISTTSPPYGWQTKSATTVLNTTDPHSGKKSVKVTSIPKGSHPGKEAIQAKVLSKPSLLWTYANPQGVLPLKADPYKFYRAAIWQAWDEGMTGFAYWIYCYREAWDYVGKKAGWAVVYNTTLADTPPEVSKKELIVPGKRWEATREGVEDYAYLYMLREAIKNPAKGTSQEALNEGRKLLVSWPKRVLGDVDNHELADLAKEEILKILSKIKPHIH